MSWDWQKTLSETTASIADIFKMKIGYEKAIEAQPLLVSTYEKTIIPTLIIVGVVVVFLIMRK